MLILIKYDHILLNMTIHEQIWSHMIIYDHIWSYMILYDHKWSYTIIYDHIWSYMIIYDYLWSYMIIYWYWYWVAVSGEKRLWAQHSEHTTVNGDPADLCPWRTETRSERRCVEVGPSIGCSVPRRLPGARQGAAGPGGTYTIAHNCTQLCTVLHSCTQIYTLVHSCTH